MDRKLSALFKQTFIFGLTGLPGRVTLSPVAASGHCPLVSGTSFSPLTAAHGLWGMGAVAVLMGLAGHVRSPQTRAGTSVSCLGRWILNHGTTREVLTALSGALEALT